MTTPLPRRGRPALGTCAAALSAVALLLVLGPSRAGAADVTRTHDVVAVAAFYQEDAAGCERTAGNVIAVKRAVPLTGAPSPYELTVWVQRWSQCGDVSSPLNIVGWKYLDPTELEVADGLGGVTLDTTIPDAADWANNRTIPLHLNVRWANTGQLEQGQHWHYHQGSLDSILNMHGWDESWTADFTGSISDGTTDYGSTFAAWQGYLTESAMLSTVAERWRAFARFNAAHTGAIAGGAVDEAYARWFSVDPTGCQYNDTYLDVQAQDSVPRTAAGHAGSATLYSYVYDACAGEFRRWAAGGAAVDDSAFSFVGGQLESARLRTPIEVTTLNGEVHTVLVDVTWSGTGVPIRTQFVSTGISAGARFTVIQRQASRLANAGGSITDGDADLSPAGPATDAVLVHGDFTNRLSTSH